MSKIGLNQRARIADALNETGVSIDRTIAAVKRNAGAEAIEYHAQVAREAHEELRRLVKKFVLELRVGSVNDER